MDRLADKSTKTFSRFDPADYLPDVDAAARGRHPTEPHERGGARTVMT